MSGSVGSDKLDPNLTPILDMVFKNGVNDFIYKGINGRWLDLLTSADIEKYERLVKQKLSPDCAHWLATGDM